VAKYRKSREFILKQLDSISEIKSIAPADGGFYVYIDLGEELVCREKGLGSTEMCRMLLEEKGVIISGCDSIGIMWRWIRHLPTYFSE